MARQRRYFAKALVQPADRLVVRIGNHYFRTSMVCSLQRCSISEPSSLKICIIVCVLHLDAQRVNSPRVSKGCIKVAAR